MPQEVRKCDAVLSAHDAHLFCPCTSQALLAHPSFLHTLAQALLAQVHRLHAFGLASGRTCIAFNLGDNLPPTYKPEPGGPPPPTHASPVTAWPCGAGRAWVVVPAA